MYGLPTSLNYSTKATSAVARSYTANLQPAGSLSNYKPNSICTINVPTNFNSVLFGPESVLKFSIKPLSTTGVARLDSCGAHAAIRRIRIYHGTNLLEDTEEYNLFAKEMYDLQVSNDSMGKYSILAGARPDMYGTVDATSTSTDAPVISRNKNSGELLSLTEENVYCVTLLSLLGSLGGRNPFPLFAATAAPLRLELTFVSSLNSMCCTHGLSTDGFEINNIEFIGSFMELSDAALNTVLSTANGGVFSYNTVGIRNYQDTMATQTAGLIQKNMNIPARYSSVKSLIISMRDSNQAGQEGFYPLGTYKYKLNAYSFRIGSNSAIPAKSPDTVPNYFYELLKCVNSVSNVDHQPSIDMESYKMDLTTAVTTDASVISGNTQSGSFYIGLNCESFANSDNTNFYAGLNTSNEDVTCMLKLKDVGVATSLRLDCFVSFDQELRFENSVCYVTF